MDHLCVECRELALGKMANNQLVYNENAKEDMIKRQSRFIAANARGLNNVNCPVFRVLTRTSQSVTSSILLAFHGKEERARTVVLTCKSQEAKRHEPIQVLSSQHHQKQMKIMYLSLPHAIGTSVISCSTIVGSTGQYFYRRSPTSSPDSFFLPFGPAWCTLHKSQVTRGRRNKY